MYRDNRCGQSHWDRDGDRSYSTWDRGKDSRGSRHRGRGRGRGASGFLNSGEEEYEFGRDRWDRHNHQEGYRGHGRDRRGGRGGRGRDREANRGDYEGRNKHPHGLKGKEIGLFYARKSKEKTEQRDREQRAEVKMVGHQERNIRKLLHDIKSSRECPPQPSRSGTTLPQESDMTDWFDGDKEIKVDSGATGSSVDMSRPMSEVSTSNFEEMETEVESLKEESVEASTGQEVETSEETDADVPAISEMMEEAEEYLFEENEVGLPESDKVNTDLLNLDLHYKFIHSQEKDAYQEMQTFRKKLPSYDDRQNIIDTINENQVVVLSGETGCGKTTQVPQYILDDYLMQKKGSECRIVCTQPRRISAISVAERVAAERAEECGESVGYMIRLEQEMPRTEGSILYCTTGILLRILESDLLLHTASHIIIDEIHERDLLSDFLLIIMKDILPKRPELKLILMSATLNAEAFSKYFHNCPMISIPGFTYPVWEYLLEDVVELLRYKPQVKKVFKRKHGKQGRKIEEESQYEDAWLRDLESKQRYSVATLRALSEMDMKKIDLELINQLIRYIVTKKGDGAILVFLPGWTEISSLNKILTNDSFYSPSKFRIIPLHSMMPTLNQRDVFQRPPKGVRKIIMATNIAETSITIDDVVYVIDGGRIKVKGFTPENNLATLDAEMVSRANARQRRGRAGRVQAGECYHLYSSLQESMMLNYLPPEILRTRLEELCLQIKYLKLGEILPFIKKAMQPPSLKAVEAAIGNLIALNALDHDENLLPLGKHLARMPLDPHTGKMILFGAMFGCLDPILTIAACLNFKDPFYVPLNREADADRAKLKLAEGCFSDHILLVKAFKRWENTNGGRARNQLCYDYFMSGSTLHMIQKMRHQLAGVLKELGFIISASVSEKVANRNSYNTALIKAIVCAGLYPNVAKIKSLPTKRRPMSFHTIETGHGKCELHPKSVAKEIQEPCSQWVVYHMKMKTTQVWLYDCSLVSPYSLLFFGGQINQIMEGNVNTVCVDDWIKFKASPETVQLVQDLRKEMDIVLDSKITNGRVTFWKPNCKEEAVIQAIIDLVTVEQAKKM